MNTECAIIIFAKFPQKGKVKTRLAKDTDEEFATGFYNICAERTFSEARKTNRIYCSAFIYCYNENEIEKFSKWAGNGFEIKAQVDGNLGERMEKSFNEVFANGYKKVIIIGTDIPDISTEIIETAASKLESFDFVLGPSSDGGYYLLGMKSLNSKLFDEIEWSSSSVLKITLEKIKDSGEEVFLLDEKIDIDTETDLKKWMRKCNNRNNSVFQFAETYYKRERDNK